MTDVATIADIDYCLGHQHIIREKTLVWYDVPSEAVLSTSWTWIFQNATGIDSLKITLYRPLAVSCLCDEQTARHSRHGLGNYKHCFRTQVW